MKKIICILVFCASFALSFFIFGDYAINLISLKIKNEKRIGIITDLQRKGSRNDLLLIGYNYDYMGKEFYVEKTISYGLFKKIYKRTIFSNYHIGQRKSVLVKHDNSFSFLEEEMNSEIFGRIILLLSLPFLLTYLIRIYLYKIIKKKPDKNIKIKNKKSYYKYYVQEINHNINETIIGENITLYDIDNNIDHNALKNNSIVCCGIERNENFVEIAYSRNEYQIRIFKNGEERIETVKETDDCSKINEIVYRNIF
jgi:hypothetical protein